ncbi:MAG TPA: hypothetical protein VNN76_05355 [Bacteroidota bacterium]|nr:hypothetical protein [Bacteroidota bacterium]
MNELLSYRVTNSGVLLLKGKESLDLLHRLSTNDVLHLQVGKVIQTILTTEKGRIFDLMSIIRKTNDECLVIGHFRSGDELKAWLDKFIIMEDVLVTEVPNAQHHIVWALNNVKENASVILKGGTDNVRTIENSFGEVQAYCFQSLLANGGMAHLVTVAVNEEKEILLRLGIRECGQEEFDRFRITHIIPWRPNEISESTNPLEVNLTSLVSFTKGCYIGQEVIARLDTYKKVQKHLVRFECSRAPKTVPQAVFDGEEELGTITTAVAGVNQALGFIRSSLSGRSLLHFENGGGSVEVTISDQK